ncbi:MAG: peptidase S1 [Deltaproteobacteria bacterium]|nr:peptidase S1 [Deltaproteobacteria bacterium]
MKKATTLFLMGALSAWGCGGGDDSPAVAPAPPAAATAPTTAAAPSAPAAAAGDSNFGTVSVRPGFMPDPTTASGTSGGSTDAATLNSDCNGWIAGTPDHLLVAGGDFSSLRVMAHATTDGEDVTLVIQKPDGSYMCNDDTEGFDPVVAGAFPAGTYKIWIGSYEHGANEAYKLGVSELDSVTPSSLGN